MKKSIELNTECTKAARIGLVSNQIHSSPPKENKISYLEALTYDSEERSRKLSTQYSSYLIGNHELQFEDHKEDIGHETDKSIANKLEGISWESSSIKQNCSSDSAHLRLKQLPFNANSQRVLNQQLIESYLQQSVAPSELIAEEEKQDVMEVVEITTHKFEDLINRRHCRSTQDLGNIAPISTTNIEIEANLQVTS